MAARMKKDIKDEVEFVYDLMEGAFWHVLYHEDWIRSAHRELAIAKSAAALAGVDVSKITAEDYHEDEKKSAVEFVEQSVASVLSSVCWHEEELCKAHTEVALVKAMILRGKFDIDLGQAEAAAKKRLEEPAT